MEGSLWQCPSYRDRLQSSPFPSTFHDLAQLLLLSHFSHVRPHRHRIDWLDLLTIQGTLKSLFQHHNSKATILLCSTFFMVQLSHLYMTTGKAIALAIWTFASKVVSLLFSMLSRFAIAFLPRSKHLFISQLQSLSTVILEPKKIKSVTLSIFFSIYLP